MSVDPRVRRRLGGLHLEGAKVGHPLRAGLTLDSIWEETGRIILRRSVIEGRAGSPASLKTADGPAVLGGFTWSGLFNPDMMLNIDVTDYFTTAVVLGDECPYRGWRMRSVVATGYASALYGANPHDPEPVIQSLGGAYGSNFHRVDGGWALSWVASTASSIARVGASYFYNGSLASFWFPMNFQVEVGYGDPQNQVDDSRNTWITLEGSALWPPFSAAVLTDEPQWRGDPSGYPNHP